MNSDEIEELAQVTFINGVRVGVEYVHTIVYDTLAKGCALNKESFPALDKLGIDAHKEAVSQRPKMENDMIKVVSDAFEFGIKKGMDIYLEIIKQVVNQKGFMNDKLCARIKPKADKVINDFIQLIEFETQSKH